MTVAQLFDALAASLGASLDPSPVQVGPIEPVVAGELPAVVLSVEDLSREIVGIGALPAQSRTGALTIDRSYDLADPVARFDDGSAATLLSPDRLRFFLPFGPAVGAEGNEVVDLTAADLRVEIDAVALEVVEATPGAGQVRGIATLGVLELGDAAPNAGQLRLVYSIGEWETTVDRFQGDLIVTVFDTDPATVESLTRQIETSIVDTEAILSIASRSVDVVTGPDPDRGAARQRRLVFAFDAEIEAPRLGGGGGVIRTVSATANTGSVTGEGHSETFDIPVPEPVP